MHKKNLKSYKFGLFAEVVACVYLNLKFYRILEKRFKTPIGEIDIIAKKGSQIVFVEVKARNSSSEEVLTTRQKYRIINASKYYISKKSEYIGNNLRFDLIIINKKIGLKHIKNAWNE